MSLVARSTYAPSCAPPGFRIGRAGIDSIGETLQQEGFPDCVEAVPQRIAVACWCAAQHGCVWDAKG
jgi:hypothetical protein